MKKYLVKPSQKRSTKATSLNLIQSLPEMKTKLAAFGVSKMYDFRTHIL
jgi:hypothetical protein